MNAPFFVYVDYRAGAGRPFYVGKGDEARVKKLQRRNQLHTNIARKHGQRRVIAYTLASEADAFHMERLLIAGLCTRVEDGGANFTDGGEGASNPSLETRAKLSAASRKAWKDDPSLRARVLPALRSPETAARRIAALRISPV